MILRPDPRTGSCPYTRPQGRLMSPDRTPEQTHDPQIRSQDRVMSPDWTLGRITILRPDPRAGLCFPGQTVGQSHVPRPDHMVGLWPLDKGQRPSQWGLEARPAQALMRGWGSSSCRA